MEGKPDENIFNNLIKEQTKQKGSQGFTASLMLDLCCKKCSRFKNKQSCHWKYILCRMTCLLRVETLFWYFVVDHPTIFIEFLGKHNFLMQSFCWNEMQFLVL